MATSKVAHTSDEHLSSSIESQELKGLFLTGRQQVVSSIPTWDSEYMDYRWMLVKLRHQKNDFWELDGQMNISKFPNVSSNSIINISWLPHGLHICRLCTLARHLNLGSSMVRASYRSSDGCGFNPRLGLRNRFSEVWAWQTSNGHPRMSPNSHMQNISLTQSTVWTNKLDEDQLIIPKSLMRNIVHDNDEDHWMCDCLQFTSGSEGTYFELSQA